MKTLNKIKAIVSIFVLVAACTLSMSFVIVPMDGNSEVNSSWYTSSTDKLYNSEYEITLTLYSNGYVTLKSSNGPSSGNYTIDSNDKIVINWDGGDSEYGYVTRARTTSGTRIRSAVIQGVTFENQERFVVPR
ncbi:MAG: hypothetical protein IJP65_09825 [Bacteroidales bacterium]|nr:hypothetical protein [Bacteroidales bacterium]